MPDPFFTHDLAQANRYLGHLRQINLHCMHTICKTYQQKIDITNQRIQQLQKFKSWEDFFTTVVSLREQLWKYSPMMANHADLERELQQIEKVFIEKQILYFQNLIAAELSKINNARSKASLLALQKQLTRLKETFRTNNVTLVDALNQLNATVDDAMTTLAKTNISNFIRVGLGMSKTYQAIDILRIGLKIMNQWKVIQQTKVKPHNEFIAYIIYPFNHDDINTLRSINTRHMQLCCQKENPCVHDFNYAVRDKMPEIVKSPQQLNTTIATLKKQVSNPTDVIALNNLEIKSYQALFIDECDKVRALITQHEKQITNRATRTFLASLKTMLLQFKTGATNIQSHQDYVGHLSLLHIQLSQSLEKLSQAQATAKQTSNPVRTLFGLSKTGVYRNEMKEYLTGLNNTIASRSDYSLLQNLNIGNYLSQLIQSKQASYIAMRKERDGGFVDTLFRQHSLKEYNLNMANKLAKVQNNANPITIYDKATLYKLLSRISDHIKHLQNEKTDFLGNYWSQVAKITLSGLSSEIGILFLPFWAPIVMVGVAAGIPITLIELALLPGKGTMLGNIEMLQKEVLAEINHDVETMFTQHNITHQSSCSSRL